MLSLTRKKDEEIFVEVDGRVIRLVITDTRSKRCTIGFDAPKDVKITRGEIIGGPKTCQSIITATTRD